MKTLFNQLVSSINRAIANKSFVRKHGNRFLTCYDYNSEKRFNGQVINTINPLNIKIKLAKNGQVITLKAKDIQIIKKDHKQLYNFKHFNSKAVILQK